MFPAYRISLLAMLLLTIRCWNSTTSKMFTDNSYIREMAKEHHQRVLATIAAVENLPIQPVLVNAFAVSMNSLGPCSDSELGAMVTTCIESTGGWTQKNQVGTIATVFVIGAREHPGAIPVATVEGTQRVRIRCGVSDGSQ